MDLKSFVWVELCTSTGEFISFPTHTRRGVRSLSPTISLCSIVWLIPPQYISKQHLETDLLHGGHRVNGQHRLELAIDAADPLLQE
jgi:hypothetical protein